MPSIWCYRRLLRSEYETWRRFTVLEKQFVLIATRVRFVALPPSLSPADERVAVP